MRRDKAARLDSLSVKTEERQSKKRIDIDRYVSENPEVFGLGHIPVRGSAGKHFRDKETEARGREGIGASSSSRRSKATGAQSS